MGAALGMHPIKTTDDEAVDHVDDRLGNRVVDRFERRHTLLNDHRLHLQAFLDDGHLVPLLAVQRANVVRLAYRHDAHAVSPGIGLHDRKRLLVDPIFGVFARDALEQR